MNLSVDYAHFGRQVDNFRPDSNEQSRALALYAASIVLADAEPMSRAVEAARRYEVARAKLYEVVLQSYLFLGFPRMLIAAEHLYKVWPGERGFAEPEPISAHEAAEWFAKGGALYRRVYGDKDQVLKQKVMGMAPEVFRWMLIEGYGKVLSRPELDVTDRELCIVAQLTMENREKQLHSHIRGAINVGVPRPLVKTVVEDIGDAAGIGYKTARRLLEQIEIG